MKKILLLISLFLLTGCYNYEEINNIILVNGIYIDYQDNKYIGIFDTDDLVTVQGESINDLFRNFEESSKKKPFYAHLKVLILSKEALNNNFDEIIDYFLRNNEIRNNFYLAASNNINSFKSSHIKSMITNKNDVITSTLFKKVLTTYLDNKEIFIPIVEDENITGSIIKKKDKVKELNINETRLYKIVKNKHPNIIYKNINIYHSKTKYKDNTYYISLDAELKENSNDDIKVILKKDLEEILGKKVNLTLDINRNGQVH